jgi:hypothetical protein
MLIMMQDIVGNFEAWSTHHQGLQDMVRLRGGVQKINQNTHLRVTISWYERHSYCLVEWTTLIKSPAGYKV